MMADEMPEMGHRGPKALGGSPVGIMLYVDDVARTFEKAVVAGATVQTAPFRTSSMATEMAVDLTLRLRAPTISTHVEDVPPKKCRGGWRLCTGRNHRRRERTHRLWIVCGQRYAGLLCPREAQPMVHSGLCRGLRPRRRLWLSARGVALWAGGRRLVGGRGAPLVAGDAPRRDF